ncbi:MAG: 4Fe-4S binding protein [Syntrophales bacterium]
MRLLKTKSIMMIVLVALFSSVAIAMASVNTADKGQLDGSTAEIRGRMTIAEIEKSYQVPAVYLIERLKLPPGTSLHEPLKELKDRHNFAMEDVQSLVREYRAGKGEAPAPAAVVSGAPKAGEEAEHREHGQEAFSAPLILVLYGLSSIVMLLLLRKNRVDRNVRLAVLAGALLIFGVLFQSQVEPLRALVQFFQALGMDRYGIWDTLLVAGAFTLITLIGVKLVCGWGCPVGALQELLYHLPVFAGIRKKRFPFWLSNGLRVSLFIMFLIFVFGWIPGFRDQSIYRYMNPFKLFEWNFRVTAPIVVAIIFALSTMQYRIYCLWICPFGLLSWLLQDVSVFRVRVDRATCINCKKCVRVCPTDAAKGIYEGKAIKVDCFSCGRCLEACPNGSLRYETPGRGLSLRENRERQ